MKHGDRVRLTDQMARIYNKRMHSNRVDWHDRRGVIKSISYNKKVVWILWDGRHSLDEMPVFGLLGEEWLDSSGDLMSQRRTVAVVTATPTGRN